MCDVKAYSNGKKSDLFSIEHLNFVYYIEIATHASVAPGNMAKIFTQQELNASRIK